MDNLDAVDADVRHHWATTSELVEYMPRNWRRFFNTVDAARGPQPVPRRWYQTSGPEYVPGSIDAFGAVPGADPLTFATYCDAEGIRQAVLGFDNGALIPALTNHYIALAAAKAANNWTIERFLSNQSDRLYGLMMVPNQLPAEAAREIRRVGRHPRIVGALMGANGIGKPFGHPLYHPIYAAAADMGLPIVVRAGGDAVPDTLTHPAGGGLPMTFGEYNSLLGCSLMAHLVSMIGQGVFERFPDLKVLLEGGGTAWIPFLLWRADTEWKGLRRDVPWVRFPPSEYFRRHVRVATHPVSRSQGPERLAKLLGAVPELSEVLCFGSGFPLYNADSVADAAVHLPSAWRGGIFRDNAAAVLRWDGKRTERRTPANRLSPVGEMTVGVSPGPATRPVDPNEILAVD